MADMNVPGKSGLGSGVWWIVGVLAAVLILWVLYSLGNPRPA